MVPHAYALILSPSGRRIYALNSATGRITPISTRTSRALPEISGIAGAYGGAISADGSVIYEVSATTMQVVPVALATGAPGSPQVAVGDQPFYIVTTTTRK